mgnify:CR=1 FL=1
MKLSHISEALIDRVHGSTPVIVYHGTSSAVLPSIRKHGLLAGQKVRDILHQPGSEYVCDELSVTTDITYTEQWCEEAVHNFGGEPVILKMNIPRGQLQINRENMAYTEPSSAVSVAFVRKGRISPDKITIMWLDGKETPLLTSNAQPA